MNLKNLRKKHGVAIFTAAAKTNLSSASLSRIERGLQIPRPEVIAQLSNLYGVAPAVIMQMCYEAYMARVSDKAAQDETPLGSVALDNSYAPTECGLGCTKTTPRRV